MTKEQEQLRERFDKWYDDYTESDRHNCEPGKESIFNWFLSNLPQSTGLQDHSHPTKTETDWKGKSLQKTNFSSKADSPTPSEWISVKDRLPEKEQLVLCYFDGMISKHRRMRGRADDIDEHGVSYHHIVRQLVAHEGIRWADEGVTHWMPIPPPPHENQTI